MHRKNGSNKTFYFKQFHIHHDRCAMKVGTDSVLLGAWANIEGAKKILDIGSGSGVLTLMLAQRTSVDVEIHGVEIDHQAYLQACLNAQESPWYGRIKFYHQAIQQFSEVNSFDLVVCNPPYFTNSKPSPYPKRTQARHNAILPYEDLVDGVKRLIKKTGRFAVILPYVEGLDFIILASMAGLVCSRKWSFCSAESKSVSRLLLEFSYTPSAPESAEIILYAADGKWTDAYARLVAPFYLDQPKV